MPGKSYILSPHCKLLTLEQLDTNKLPNSLEREKILSGELFVLEDDYTWHLVNPTIKAFLEAFQQTTTLEAVIGQFADKAKCRPEQIEEVMNRFFQSMKRRKFIIDPSQTANSKAGFEKRVFQSGQMVSHYQIKRRIFQKKKWEIYTAGDLKNERNVVIKVLKAPQGYSAEQLQKLKHNFIQEFRLMAELKSHPNICSFYEIFDQDGLVFGVMEQITNTNLRRYINKSKPSIEGKIHLIRQVIASIAHLHRNGMLHGDIHLSNFLLQDQTKVKLIDFNMSNRLDPHEDEIIREGGVYQYIPPEKVDGRAFCLVKSRADFRSEVFQTGVIVYFMLFEKMPFQAFTWKALCRKILHEEPQWPATTPRGESIPLFCLQMLKSMLQKDPGERHSSMVELEREINILNPSYAPGN